MESTKEKKWKGKGGRKKVTPALLSNKLIKIYVTESELTQINNDFKASGNNSRSDYLKKRLLESGKALAVNPVDFLKSLDKIGMEINRIGNNINQMARYANMLSLRREIDAYPLKKFNVLMDKYLETRRDLVKAYRAVIKKV